MTLYQIAQTVPLCWARWPPELKIEKTFKWLLLLNQKMDFEIIIQECFLGDPVPKLLKRFRYVEQNGRRAINRNKLLTTFSAKSVDRFWNNFTGMFLRWLSTKIAQTVPLRWTRWPPELKLEKTFKRLLLLNQKMDFEIILQECFLGDPLPKLLKWFRYVEQNGR